MSNYLNEAGPLIWLVVSFGVVALAAAIVYAARQQRRWASAALGASAASIITALLAAMLGYQISVAAIGDVDPARRWLVMVGLSESLNNLVVAGVFALLVSLLLTVGAWLRSPGTAH